MPQDKLISIIVPVYNTEKYIDKCIQSILSQTYKIFELLLIDDGSTDNSGAICDNYAKKDDRVKVFHKVNGGQATARNLALQIILGEYVGFVDADDWIEPNMFEELIHAIGDNDIVMCGRYNVAENTGCRTPFFTSDSPIQMDSQEAIRRFLLYDKIDGASCDKLFKRELLYGDFYPEGYICEDLPFVYNVLKKANGVIHVGKPLYNYLQRSGSTSKSTFSHKTWGIYKYSKEICEDVIKNFPNLSNEARSYYRKSYFTYLKKYFDSEVHTGFGFKIEYKDIFCGYYSLKEKVLLLLMKYNLYRNVKSLIKRN